MDYITGAHGFIGQHLTTKVGDFVAIPHKQIADYRFSPFDNFFFLSSYGNLYWQEDDEEIIKANVLDVISIIQKIKGFNFKSFVFLSTSSVKRPRQTMYSRCKNATEEILLSFIEKYKAPISIIRPFSVTGVGEQNEHLIPTLIRTAYEKTPFTFVPEPTHDWIDVEDVVDCILNLSKNRARGIFEAGTGVKTSNQEVKKLVEKVTKKKIEAQEVDVMRSYDDKEWVSTNFRSRMYGWQPKKTLEQSIKEMVNDYLAKKSA